MLIHAQNMDRLHIDETEKYSTNKQMDWKVNMLKQYQIL